ncbi:MAG: CaiB/BaiF CoA transferase family protein [Bosea sp. (in: a-proteobacteria)]
MQPLSGIIVLDFSTLLPGPLASLMLAECGATVIKVERPGGEDMRGFPPAFGETSAPFASLNGGKQSIAIDLKHPNAVALLTPLIAKADIVLDQFRPGVMDRLGLGYEALCAINPRVILCSITGYGQTGPRAQEAGHDINYQARSGLLSLMAKPGEQAPMPPPLVADIAGGAMPAMLNILLALRQRDLTGEGCHLDIAMADGALTFAWYGLAEGAASGKYPKGGQGLLTGGSPRYRLYATSDDRFLAVGALEQKFWDVFCEAIGLEEGLRNDSKNAEAAGKAVAALIVAQPSAHWRDLLEPRDCCCTIVAQLDEAITDPQFAARQLFAHRSQEPSGQSLPSTVLPIAPIFRASSETVRLVPGVGQDNAAVLKPDPKA